MRWTVPTPHPISRAVRTIPVPAASEDSTAASTSPVTLRLPHLAEAASAGLRTAMQGSRSARVTWLTLLSVYCQGSYDIVVGALTRAVLGGTHD